jgi:alpha-beta hydrolase superfamily lysophospholipase
VRTDSFWFEADDDKRLFVHRFLPDEGTALRAVMHVAHGMAEHGARYARLAEALTKLGFAVYADDHRGHGKTAATDAELGHLGDEGGFARVLRDLTALLARHRSEHPDLPLVFMGHSMGSYFVQAYLLDGGEGLAAAVLSGTSGKPSLLASAGRLVARAERARLGPRGKSKLLGDLSFGAFNKAFAPTRTDFDWLSRDPAEVDAYVADPRCGFDVTTSTWVEVLDALAHNADPKRRAGLRKDLPIYVFSGSEDPVGERTHAVDRLLAAYKGAGLTRVAHRYYAGARHETLNETNRDEVTRDLVQWLRESVHGI